MKQLLKSLFRTYGIVICLVLIIAAILTVRAAGAGTFFEKPLDLTVLTDTNPARRELQIEKTNTATVIVKDISRYKTLGVSVEFEANPEVKAALWLSDKDVACIDPGDRITVRGHIKYYENGFTGAPAITIGDAISIFPCTFKARLINIEKAVLN